MAHQATDRQAATDRRGVGKASILGLAIALGWQVLGGPVLNWFCPALVADAGLRAEDAAGKASEIRAAEGQLTLTVPGEWVRKQPTVNMIEHEYAAPTAEAGQADGRLTMMLAGGSLDANIERWVGQFSAGKGGNKPVAKRESLKAGEQKVEWVDIEGTYQDRRGPLAPAVARDNYRMLGAIVETKGGGLFFLKFYGPKATMDKHEAAFRSMVEGIRSAP
jgi:hypothetical protein